jgi:hypothetical protein
MFPLLAEDLFKSKITVTLLQILVCVLRSQLIETGRWGKNGSSEGTAYAILTLANLVSLQLVQPTRTQLDLAVVHGRNYILSMSAANV